MLEGAQIAYLLGLLFCLAQFVSVDALASSQKLCDRVVIRDGHIHITANQKVLICGERSSDGGWHTVPLLQAQLQLKTLLQSLGYLQPTFEQRDGTLWVTLGRTTDASQLEVIGVQGILNVKKKRKVVGYPLSSQLLDEVTSWAQSTLTRAGYPCPIVNVEARTWNKAVAVIVDSGPRQEIESLSADGLDGLDISTLKRYQAFEVGEIYNRQNEELTANRLVSDGVLQSAYFSRICSELGVDLTLHASVGPSQLLRIGVGASTEELGFADLLFRNSRLDSKSSSWSATLHGSSRRQSSQLTSELYWFTRFPRVYLSPKILFTRQSEDFYEVLSAETGLNIGRKWDSNTSRYIATFGPTLNYTNTIRGSGPDDVSYLSWNAILDSVSHELEATSGAQESGWSWQFEYRGQRRGLGSPLNIDRYQLKGKYLWNIGSFSPPLFILGLRGEGISVTSSQGNIATDAIPIDYRIYYGGERNLRGFARQALNNEKAGYLTSLYFGGELRLIEELPFHLQPFLLADIAQLGARSLTLGRALYTSLGLGLRWVSPIGTVRGFAAHGQIKHPHTNYREDWIYFLGLGQEF